MKKFLHKIVQWTRGQDTGAPFTTFTIESLADKSAAALLALSQANTPDGLATRCIAVSRDGRYLAMGGDKKIIVWQLK